MAPVLPQACLLSFREDYKSVQVDELFDDVLDCVFSVVFLLSVSVIFFLLFSVVFLILSCPLLFIF